MLGCCVLIEVVVLFHALLGPLICYGGVGVLWGVAAAELEWLCGVAVFLLCGGGWKYVGSWGCCCGCVCVGLQMW